MLKEFLQFRREKKQKEIDAAAKLAEHYRKNYESLQQMKFSDGPKHRFVKSHGKTYFIPMFAENVLIGFECEENWMSPFSTVFKFYIDPSNPNGYAEFMVDGKWIEDFEFIDFEMKDIEINLILNNNEELTIDIDDLLIQDFLMNIVSLHKKDAIVCGYDDYSKMVIPYHSILSYCIHHRY